MPDDRPVALHHLSFAGQLLVWSARHWVARDGHWRRVEAEFMGPLGTTTGQSLATALDDLYSLMNAAALRPMIFGPLQCRSVWRDEGLIVRLVELEQQNESAWVLDLLGRVLPPAAARRAITLVADVAYLLSGAGYTVSVDGAETDEPQLPRPAMMEGGKVTIH